MPSASEHPTALFILSATMLQKGYRCTCSPEIVIWRTRDHAFPNACKTITPTGSAPSHTRRHSGRCFANYPTDLAMTDAVEEMTLVVVPDEFMLNTVSGSST